MSVPPASLLRSSAAADRARASRAGACGGRVGGFRWLGADERARIDVGQRAVAWGG